MHGALSYRPCLREPIPEIWDAARLLDAAVVAHFEGCPELVTSLIEMANMPAIREWTNSLWGKGSPYRQFRGEGPEPRIPKKERRHLRMPDGNLKKLLHDRDGFHCRFCGIPVIRAEVRRRFVTLYPTIPIWGNTIGEQHAAFQAMWAQYDHIVPHARGGDNEIDNLVVTCAPCNYGRMSDTLEELGLSNPRDRTPVRSQWDGLERLLTNLQPMTRSGQHG